MKKAKEKGSGLKEHSKSARSQIAVMKGLSVTTYLTHGKWVSHHAKITSHCIVKGKVQIDIKIGNPSDSRDIYSRTFSNLLDRIFAVVLDGWPLLNTQIETKKGNKI